MRLPDDSCSCSFDMRPRSSLRSRSVVREVIVVVIRIDIAIAPRARPGRCG